MRSRPPHFSCSVGHSGDSLRPVPPEELTLLLQRADAGDTQAAERILPLVYDELRKLAAAKMARESTDQTLQPTALVHEAWLRLGGASQPDWKNRAHFFAAAAEAMRRILIDRARRKQRQRHGGGLEKVSVDRTGFDVGASALGDEELLVLDEALTNLAAHDARKAALVQQWFFAGLTVEQAAEVLGISARTAHRDWLYARAWLTNEIERLRG
jgi:RNA polymerase sigma factor (TIGR02999 family)